MLWNLCQNAYQHGSRGDEGTSGMEIRTGMDPESGRPFLEVRDNGPGIPEQERDAIFEPFFTTDRQGTGLGLYLAKELCESNQALLSYHPLSPRGSAFRIDFPAASPEIGTRAGGPQEAISH